MRDYIQTRVYNINKGSMNLYDQNDMETKMSKEVGEHFFIIIIFYSKVELTSSFVF